MPYSNRHAPEDTAIHREELSGNIDVRGPGRYYPDEYNSQIQAIHQRGQIIADVPATLAGIVIDRNDHALSTWYNKEKAELYDEQEFYKQLEANKRQLLDLDSELQVHDTMVKLDSDLTKARQYALNNDGKVYEEYAKVLDNYKGMYDDVPALASKFNGRFQQLAQDSLRKGLEEDIKTGYLKVGNILQISGNNINNTILSGDIGAIEGIQQFIKDNAKWLSKFPATQIPDLFNNVFNLFVQTEADAVINEVKAGNLDPENAMKQLQGLRLTYATENTFNLVDENGQVLKDTDNNNRTVTFTIDPKTQAKLDQYLKDTSSGGLGNAGEEKLLGIEDGFKTKLGWKEIEEKGYSSNLLSTTPEQLDTWFDEFINNVLASGVSASKKQSSINDCMNMYMQAKMMLKVSDIAKAAGSDVSNVLTALALDIDEHRKNNNINFDWTSYTPTINGVSYDLGFGTTTAYLQTRYGSLGLAPTLGTNSNEASVYWTNFQNILEKAARNAQQGQVSDYLNTHNGSYSANSNKVSAFMDNKLITKNQDGAYNINLDTVQNYVIPSLEVLKKEADKAGFKTAIDPSQIDTWVKNISTNVKDPSAQYQAFKGLLVGLNEAKCIGDVYKYAMTKAKENQNINSKEEENMAGLFLATWALSKEGNVEKLREDLIASGQYKNNYKIAVTDKDNKIEQAAREIYGNLYIPPEQQGMYNTLKAIVGATSVDADGNIDIRTFKNNFKSVLQEQYITIPNQLGKSNGLGKKALLKDANYMEPFKTTNGGIDTNKLNEMCTESIELFNRAKDFMPFLKDSHSKVEFFPDLERGEIYLKFNDRIEKDNKGNIIGRLIYDKDLKDISSKRIGQITALNVITNVLSRNAVTGYKEIKKGIERATQMGMLSPRYNLKDLGTEEDYLKTVLSYRNILNDPVKCKKILKQSQANYSNGYIQSINHKKPYIYFFGNLGGNFEGYVMKDIQNELEMESKL